MKRRTSRKGRNRASRRTWGKKLPLVQQESPFQHLSEEQRQQLVKAVREGSRKQFTKRLDELKDLVWEQDPLLLLSHLSFYFLFAPPEEDPELQEREGGPVVLQHHVELVHAVALSRPQGHPHEQLLDPQRVVAICEAASELGILSSMRRLPAPGADDKLMARAAVQEDVRMFTAAVRNWGYPEQMFRITAELWAPLDGAFEEAFGIGATVLVRCLQQLIRAVETRASTHSEKLHRVFRKRTNKTIGDAYLMEFPHAREASKEIEAFKVHAESPRRMKDLVLFHSELCLPDVFTFSLEELASLCPGEVAPEALAPILEKWSYSPGELSEEDPERFFLSLPTHERPLIRVEGNRYFVPVAGLLVHTCMALPEALVADHDLRKRYERRRATYLPDRARDLFERGFPGAQVAVGSQWRDPIEGRQYENDLLVVVDRTAILVEAKSGRYTAPARRGAEKSLTERLDELVVEPARQAARFRHFLEDNCGELELDTKAGPPNRVDLTDVTRFVTLSLNLDIPGPIKRLVVQAEAAGLLADVPRPLVPCMTLADLEIVFEILDSETEKIHYLARRMDLEENLPYVGEEVDLLAFYIDTGFVIGEKEFDGTSFSFMMKSKELDPYFMSRFEGVPGPPKPRRPLGSWWRDCIRALEHRKSPGWTEAAYVLLSTAHEDQKTFHREVERLGKEVAAGRRKGTNHVAVLTMGPGRRRHTVVACLHGDIGRQERRNLMGNIVADVLRNDESIVAGVGMGVQVSLPIYPYGILVALTRDMLLEEGEAEAPEGGG